MRNGAFDGHAAIAGNGGVHQYLTDVGIFSGNVSLIILVDTLKNAAIFSLESIDSPPRSPHHYTEQLEGIAYVLLVLVLLATHLKHATHLTARKRWAIASVLPVIGVCSAMLMNFLDEERPSAHDTEESCMLPGYLRISRVKSTSDFINGLDRLEELALDEAKKAKD